MVFSIYMIKVCCRIQVFHVVEHTGEGGQTLLVDGFHAGENIRTEHPDSFDLLTKALIHMNTTMNIVQCVGLELYCHFIIQLES